MCFGGGGPSQEELDARAKAEAEQAKQKADAEAAKQAEQDKIRQEKTDAATAAQETATLASQRKVMRSGGTQRRSLFTSSGGGVGYFNRFGGSGGTSRFGTDKRPM